MTIAISRQREGKSKFDLLVKSTSSRGSLRAFETTPLE